VKFLKIEGDNFVFQIGRREKKLLIEVLGLYPLIPASHHRVSQAPDSREAESSQKLLEEALAEHRQESKRQLQAMLNESGRFRESSGGIHFVLNAFQLEGLLQVINDVRVGCWLRLGSPDENRGQGIRLTNENARYLWVMDLCAFYEAALLAAWEQR
jgi:hypothetical protein